VPVCARRPSRQVAAQQRLERGRAEDDLAGDAANDAMAFVERLRGVSDRLAGRTELCRDPAGRPLASARA
jgi:hypothetical protein